MKPYRLVIVDDHSILQHGLCSSLETEKGIDIVGVADTGHKAIELCRTCRPDMVIMDVGMPELNGMEATKQIVRRHPGVKVLALSMHTERIYVTGMINAGARGYVLKSCSYKELLHGIQEVLSGNVYFCDEIRHLVEIEASQDKAPVILSVFSVLSRREREVLQLIAEGHKNRMIAEKLDISVKTVDIHRNNIKTKLNIHSIAELTKFAISEGLTSPVL